MHTPLTLVIWEQPCTVVSPTSAFQREDSAVASVVLGYKFGTGDAKDFTGSGADDAFMALRFSGGPWSDLSLSWHGQVGYLRAGDSDVMEEFQEQNLWFAGLSLDWRLAQRWSLRSKPRRTSRSRPQCATDPARAIKSA